MAREAKLGLTITADVRTGSALREFKKDLGEFQQTGAKASAALRLVEGAAGSMGGAVAETATKAIGLAGTLATGGPLGIALVGISAAVAAGAAVWATYKASTESVESAARSISKAIEAQSTAARTVGGDINKLNDELRFFGLTARQVAVEQLGLLIAGLEGAPARLDVMIAELETQTDEMRAKFKGKRIFEVDLADVEANNEMIRLNEMQLEGFRKAKIAKAKDLEDARAKLEAVNKLVALEAQSETQEDRNDKAKKDRAERRKKEITEQAELRKQALDEAVAAIQRETAAQEEADAARDAAATKYASGIAHLDELKQGSVTLQTELDRIATEERLGMISAEEAARQKMWAHEQQQIGEIAQSMGQVWGGVFADMISGSQDSGAAIRRGLVQTAQVAVMAAASSAAAQAAFSQAGIPILGPILATVAAGVVFAMVQAYMSKIPKAEQGQLVTGGTANRDSVMVSAMRGERVLSKEETRRYDQGRGSGGGNVTIVVPVQSVIPTMAELERTLDKRVIPIVERALRDGRMHVPRMAVA